ncbi:TolC family protein [Desulfolucanica intricata]|uniref:TolC family protein n=1 Tax=Desulfolucanica intricata TaxID=1285191 RepID=UPI00082BB766|nr:TolC family protein [Desulfolucanica intricata]
MKKMWIWAPILALMLVLSLTVPAGETIRDNGIASVRAAEAAVSLRPRAPEDINQPVNEEQSAQLTVEPVVVTAAANTAEEESAQTESTAQQADVNETKTLTMEEALKLAEENNTGLQMAKFERDKKRAAAEQAIYQRRDIPDFLDRSKIKADARVNEKQKKAEFAVADRSYEVTKTQIELLIKKNYLEVLKARDQEKVSRAALERAQEQLRLAEVAFNVGTVAKNEVLGAQAAVSSARAALTNAENTYRLKQIELSKSIGLPVDTRYNLTSQVQYQPMAEVDLNKVIEEAQKTRLDVMEKTANIEVAEAFYDVVAGYSAPYTYDAKQARASVEQAVILLEDTKKAVVSDITQAYLNVQALQKQFDALTDAVENSRESLRLTQLRYQVGMATSLDVMGASVQLSEMELNRVDALYNHYLAKLSFETAKLAPPQGLSSGMKA